MDSKATTKLRRRITRLTAHGNEQKAALLKAEILLRGRIRKVEKRLIVLKKAARTQFGPVGGAIAAARDFAADQARALYDGLQAVRQPEPELDKIMFVDGLLNRPKSLLPAIAQKPHFADVV